MLTIDRLTPDRASVIALTVAQSAAMEYYERIVEEMFGRTARLVDRMEARGTVPVSTRPLHRFIGAAIGTRAEVLSILHLLDKPDEAWDDAGMDRIYDELRAEFDLVDRHRALETKLRSVQEALELVLDVARDRRLVVLEATIVVLIVHRDSPDSASCPLTHCNNRDCAACRARFHDRFRTRSGHN